MVEKGIQAQWDMAWIEEKEPVEDVERQSYMLAAEYFFPGNRFKASEENETPTLGDETPLRTTVKAVVSKKTFTLMMRYQQGEEATAVKGGPLPLWRLINDSAVDLETGRTLGWGEVFDVYAE